MFQPKSLDQKQDTDRLTKSKIFKVLRYYFEEQSTETLKEVTEEIFKEIK